MHAGASQLSDTNTLQTRGFTSYTPVKMDMTLLSTAAQILAMWTNGPWGKGNIQTFPIHYFEFSLFKI